ncbi:uncharacterized protein A4U43_C09F8790, partial [Asparagus officinalis]
MRGMVRCVVRRDHGGSIRWMVVGSNEPKARFPQRVLHRWQRVSKFYALGCVRVGFCQELNGLE